MKTIRVHEFGGPRVLKLEEVATPKPSAGEVPVRIVASAFNERIKDASQGLNHAVLAARHSLSLGIFPSIPR